MSGKLFSPLTINYGLRFDGYHAYSSGSQLSPRVNFVWQPVPNTTVHGGYSRYFTPPPFELIAAETFSKFANTTGTATRLGHRGRPAGSRALQRRRSRRAAEAAQQRPDAGGG